MNDNPGYRHGEPPLDPNLELRIKRLHAESDMRELRRYIKPVHDHRLCYLINESNPKQGRFVYGYSFHGNWWYVSIWVPEDCDLTEYNRRLVECIQNVEDGVRNLEAYCEKDTDFAREMEAEKDINQPLPERPREYIELITNYGTPVDEVTLRVTSL